MISAKRELTTVPKFLEVNKGLIAKNLVYASIADGTIPSVRIGNKILIYTDCLERLAEDKNDKTAS